MKRYVTSDVATGGAPSTWQQEVRVRISRPYKPRAAPGRRLRLDLPNFVPYRITVLATLVRRALAEIYRDSPGLSEPEWKVMTALAHYGPVPSGNIGLYVTLDRVAVSRALARLMKMGLATRTKNVADQRTFMVELTARAERLYDRMAADALSLEKRILSGLRRKEVRTLLTLLDNIETSLRSPADRRRLRLMQSAGTAPEDVAHGGRRR
jgi:DNA-binding MarR family transcriptional regulator